MEPASAAVAEADLIPSLWQELPMDLLKKVLTKLPVSVLMKLVRVSKGWKEWIQSEEFGRNYHSVESTVFYFGRSSDRSYIALPSLKSDVWEKHFLEFAADEYVDGLVAADRGLLCYRIFKRKKGPFKGPFAFLECLSLGHEILLVVHNPLTRKWRRLVVPHHVETDLFFCHHQMLVGLIVDPETGSYKVVVAFTKDFFKDSGNALIYDSSSRTWRNSASVSPIVDNQSHYNLWEVQRSICCGGELVWLVNEIGSDEEVMYQSLIKYRLEEDTWAVVTVPCEKYWRPHIDSHVVYRSTENQLFLVHFGNFDFLDDDGDGEEYIPPPFLTLVPSMGMFSSKDLYDLSVLKI